MPDLRYNPPNRTRESDDAWTEFPTGAYVVVENSEKGDAQPSIYREDLGGSLYSVSAYHQLHCLSMIRNAWFLIVDGGPEALENVEYFPHHPHGAHLAPHVQHCFDYLRQTLQCNADHTLEPFVAEDGKTLQPAGPSGWGVKHKCRDWESLSSWVRSHDARILGWEP
ncbi:hypothetical protein F5884DRAFT_860115 [Xylogone sp. PMI_703]|nr:hypothetical protein F5884DRAFT_860115 [Xylogone sp. PMI_703]